MAIANKININTIPENNVNVFIRGKVTYSHIAKEFTQDEKVQDHARRQAKSRFNTPIPEHLTRISIKNAQVLYKDPQNPSLAEQYIGQKCYQATKNVADGMCFIAESKSPSLPVVCLESDYNNAVANNEPVHAIALQGEIAKETDVTLVMQIFTLNNYGGNKGCGLGMVIVNAPEIPYYQPSQISSLGVKVEMPTPEARAAANQILAATNKPAAPATPAQPAYQQPAAPQYNYQQTIPQTVPPAAPQYNYQQPAAPAAPAAPQYTYQQPAAQPAPAAPQYTYQQPVAPAAPGITPPAGTPIPAGFTLAEDGKTIIPVQSPDPRG